MTEQISRYLKPFSLSGLKMVHKGMVLVLIPLAAGLVFVGSLIYVISEYEKQLTAAALAHEIYSCAFESIQSVQQAGLAIVLLYNNEAESPIIFSQYTNRREKFRQLTERLQELLKGTPEEVAKLRQFHDSGEEVMKLMDRLALLHRMGGKKFAPLEFVSAHDDVRHFMSNQFGLFEELMNRQKDFEKQSQRKALALRVWVYRLVFGGIPGVIAVCGVTAFLFGREVSGRVGILADNANRFSNHQPLHEPLSGGDEISELDRVFHEMALTVSESQKREAALTERLRMVIESVPVGILVLDPSGLIEQVNSKIAQMYRCETSELTGKNIVELFNSDVSPELFMPMLRQRAIGNVIELDARTDDERGCRLEVSAAEIQRESGSQIFVSLLDVSERYHAQRLKRNFVSMISHDIRTPLTTIHMTLDAVHSHIYGTISERGDAMVENAGTEAERLMRLVGDLMQIEKMEDGKLDMAVKPISLEEAMTRAAVAVNGIAEKSGVAVERQPPAKAIALADMDRIVQVLVNLLTNGIKYSARGGTVTMTAVERDGLFEISVADAGKGVPLARQNLIFLPFQQVSLSDARDLGGTGLGLAICKMIVEAHGGTIGLDSKENEGSRFWFTLPKAPAVAMSP